MLESHLPKKFKVKKNQKDLEPNDIFLDNLAQKKEEETGLSAQKIEIKLSYNKFLSLFFLFFIFILFLLFYSFYFQTFENKNFQALANENKYITSSLTASRGVIYDNSGKQLVSNEIIFDLFIDKSKTTEKELIKFSELIGINFEELQINNFLLKNIDIDTLILVKSHDFDFVSYDQSLVRKYENPEIFSHIIGYLGKISQEELQLLEGYTIQDYVGKMGLEKSYDNLLKKKPGQVLIERDTFGNVLSQEIISLSEPGYNLELWLNADLQIKLYEELEKVTTEAGSNRAVAIAMDPRTGGVLALVSLPGFDNNLFSSNDQENIQEIFQDPRKPFFNRAIAGLYAAGSTIKPLTGLAALEEGIISANQEINCKGQITIPHRYDPSIIYTFRDLRVHGLSNMQKAIAESCNVYFYTIGGGYERQQGLGADRIKEYLEYFGWGKETGIDLPGEKNGLIPSPEWKQEVKNEGWWTGDTYNLSIGQGDIGITPLQIVNSFSIIANNGTLYSPKIVKNILDQDKNIIQEIKPEIIIENLFSEKNLEIIRGGMKKAVTGEGVPNATSRMLNYLPVSSAAKTGTAQTSRPNLFHNWITVFAPYEEPEIVLTVLIEDVEGIQLTSTLVAQKILEWYFNHDN